MSNILNDLSSWETTEKKVLSKVVDKKPVRKSAPKKVPPKKTTFKSSNPDNLPIDPKMEKFLNNLSGVGNEDDELDIEEQLQVAARTKKAEMEIKEQKAIQEHLNTAVKRGQLLDRALFYDYMIPFVDGLLGDIQRVAGSFLTDISKQIVSEGSLSPEIRAKWDDKILSIQDESKKRVMQDISEIEKIQAEK